MKKILMTLVAVAMATTMNAQWFVGGSLGFGSSKVAGGSSESTFKIVPEVGYNLNDKWAFGVSLGYQKGACDFGNFNFTQGTQEVFTVTPYARYSFLKWERLTVFCDGGFGVASVKDQGTGFQIGLKPGFAIKASDKISFVAHIGALGFETFSPKGGGSSSNNFGLNVNGVANTFGIYYNF